MDHIILGVESAQAATSVGAASLSKGAVLGAMLVSASFLAGFAVLKKSSAAFCGLLMLIAAGALQAVWLGVVPAPAPSMVLFLQGLFAASGLLFVSTTIGVASRNQLVGGALFVGALCLAGIGVINLFLGGDAASLQRAASVAAATVAIGLAIFASMRGDLGARLLAPGVVLAAAAPAFMSLGGAGAFGPSVVLAIGVILASLVALGEFGERQSPATHMDGVSAQFDAARRRPDAGHLHTLRVSENQLAQVLDYSGVAVWDWSRSANHQTASFGAIMGADGDGAFTPEAFAEFVHGDDKGRFETSVYGAADGDGGFDEVLKLHSGKKVRVRGARAVDYAGRLERIVVFLEEFGQGAAATPRKEDALKLAAASLTSAALSSVSTRNPANSDANAPVATSAGEATDIVAAIEAGAIVAAFQPIVSFEDGRVCGAEALVRWPANGAASMTPEDIVKAAQSAGKGGALTRLMLNAAAHYACERLAAGERNHFTAFNVSLSQVKEDGFVSDVRKAITEHKLPRGALVLEMTEGERLAETPKIVETFKALKAAGAALAYDDFGAGFSSLSNLHKYDFDYLKIDKSFIDDIVANGGKKKIVAALAKLGREFDMGVIAEGVETKEAAEIAKAIGCKMGQGYYLGTPALPAATPAAPEEATVVIEKAFEASAANDGEIVLDRSMQTTKSEGRPLRRRLFGRGAR